MATSIDAIELFARTVVQSQPWLHDPGCVPLSWNERALDSVISERKLRIGVLEWMECAFLSRPSGTP